MTRAELQKQLYLFWETVVSKLSMSEAAATTPQEKDLFDLVEDARQEWQAAMSHFNQVTDPDLVDHAIHAMEAAEKKYTYLLKKARREGYRLPATLDVLRERRAARANI
ncbi:YaaL family protein [Dethiobacter alkaliphilus]|uniref:YaaL family protein n=1 Tax=Dethiobacter alkaliphilus TaxID=427926 RepID=UPI0022275D5E|nr:YaaL family protein [Dethiobacter alkaliphilus]MCW3489079.1 YaaL family protein [Dethiobacter alkaliphilus]